MFILIIFISNACYAQYLYLGLQFTQTNYSFDINKDTYYLSDSRNSNLTATSIETTTTNPFQILIPALYLNF